MTRVSISSCDRFMSAWNASRSAAFSASTAAVRTSSTVWTHVANARRTDRYRILTTICRTRIILHRMSHHALHTLMTSMFFIRVTILADTFLRLRRRAAHARQEPHTLAFATFSIRKRMIFCLPRIWLRYFVHLRHRATHFAQIACDHLLTIDWITRSCKSPSRRSCRTSEVDLDHVAKAALVNWCCSRMAILRTPAIVHRSAHQHDHTIAMSLFVMRWRHFNSIART